MIGFELAPGYGQRGYPSPQPLASFFAPADGQRVAIAEGTGGNLSVWTEISPTHAAWMDLDNQNASTRLSWRETVVAELRNIYPIGAMSLSSGWSQLQSSGSGLTGSYTGNRAVSTTSQTATATVTVSRARTYDVWIHYTGRTSGGYARVEIDGAQTLVNEIDDPAGLGFKAFSTYSATDLQRRQSVKIASGLTGSHEITVSNGGAATPGGNVLLLEAVAISGALDDPRILPPLWQPGVAYEMGDEVQYGGIFYAARANGVSGTTGPTHTGGIASDGALDWRADYRPSYPLFTAVDYASEREYALRFTVDGAATELGGQTHGNEALINRTILLDGVPWVPATTGNGLSVGAQLRIVEDTSWERQTGGAVADCTLTRTIAPGVITHGVEVVGNGPAVNCEWFYAGMAPLVRWDGEARVPVFDTVAVGTSLPVVLSDYAGINPPNLNFAGASRIGMTASLPQASLRYGCEVGPLPGPSNLVNQFDTFLRPNLEATVEGGSLDWKAKAYVTGDAGGTLSFAAGDALRFFNRHVIKVVPDGP